MESLAFFESVDKSVRTQLETLLKLLNSILSGQEIEIEYNNNLAHFSHISSEHNLVIHMALDQESHDYAQDAIRITVEKLFNDSESAVFLYLTGAHDLFRILSPLLIDALDDVHDSNNNLQVRLPLYGGKPPENFDEIWNGLLYQVNESLKFISQRNLIKMSTPYKQNNNESAVLIFQDFPYRVFIHCLRMEDGYFQYAFAYGHVFKRERMNYEASFSLSQSNAVFKLIPAEVLHALQLKLDEKECRDEDNEEEEDEED
jgi:hypothetical protein